jgi:hypothetical protein
VVKDRDFFRFYSILLSRPVSARASADCDVRRRLGRRVHDDVFALLLRHLAAAL